VYVRHDLGLARNAVLPRMPRFVPLTPRTLPQPGEARVRVRACALTHATQVLALDAEFVSLGAEETEITEVCHRDDVSLVCVHVRMCVMTCHSCACMCACV
jgi:hypothetical protein